MEEIMPPDLKSKWVEALRSGSYIQGTGKLCSNDSHCCLGVLCEICVPLGVEKFQATPDLVDYRYKGSIGAGLPPQYLTNELCLDGEEIEQLTTMNDTGKSFIEIANWIERNI